MLLYYSNLHAYRQTIEEVGQKVAVLVSFYKEVHVNNFIRQDWVSKFMLDSGAFSAFKQGISIDINEFLQYILDHPGMYDYVVSLDVIGDPVKSLENYKIMIKAGINCLPVFHIYSDMKHLFKLADQTNYIGIGGIAGKRAAERNSFCDRIFSNFPDPKKIGFHGFGVSDENVMLRFPWISCDASSMHVYCRCGGIYTPFGRYYINPDLAQEKTEWRTASKISVMREYIEGLGCDFPLAQSATLAGTKERCKISIKYLEDVAKRVPKKYNPRVNHFDF